MPLSAGAERSFNLFSPALAQRRGGLYLFLASKRARALRSLIIVGASDRRKTMRSLKLLTDAADRRKTMGTLKLLIESMQYDFTVALDHTRVVRPFF